VELIKLIELCFDLQKEFLEQQRNVFYLNFEIEFLFSIIFVTL